MVDAWLTPDGSVPSSNVCLTITIPDGLQWRASLRGALLSLGEAENWEKWGTLEPQEVADVFLQAYLAAGFGECPMIGEIKIWPTDDIPEGWLLCDGSFLLKTEYPALFDVLGLTYGNQTQDDFGIPNMIGRVPVYPDPGNGISLGSAGGEFEHTLTTAEMPAHTHPFDPHAFGFLPGGVLGLVAGALIASSINTVTGSAGAGVAHNNLQPFIGLNFIIRAE